jgi:hypothetical protein
VKEFGGNDMVVFADVNLSEGRVGTIDGTPQNPGAGGWPTLRYFNSETGYGGKKYEQKTSNRICEEMKDPAMVKAWISEFGLGPSCSIDTQDECDDREIAYIKKAEAKSADERTSQLKRLNSMKDKKMSPDAAKWVSTRISLLKQFSDVKTEL